MKLLGRVRNIDTYTKFTVAALSSRLYYIRLSKYSQTLLDTWTTNMHASNFFKALGDPTRLKLIYMLRNNQSLCVCDLTTALQQPQSTISRHLNLLKRAGILTHERRGTWIWYALDTTMPEWGKQVIDTFEMEGSLELDLENIKVSAHTNKCC